MIKLGKFFGMIVSVVGLSAAPLFAQQACDKLVALQLPDAKVLSAEQVPAGISKVPTMLGAMVDTKLPAYCRVKGEATPTSDSKIAFELWMPSEAWSGRYVQLGNGGLAGSIGYPLMYQQLARGFAVAATDDGHTGAGTDGSWAAGHPEKVIDFGYRAVHETVENSKKIMAAFYGHAQKYAYFNGCSEGGREAMMEARRFPDDFNGILAGAAANRWMELMTGFAWNAQSLLKDPESYIPEAKRPLVEAAALAACGSPGDKFIQNPMDCRFDPVALQCKGADATDCLTGKQVIALQKIYAGAKSPSTGKQLADGYEPGAEAEPGFPGVSYSSYVFGPQPGTSLALIFSSSFYGSFVFDNPKYNVLTLDFDKDVPIANQKLSSIMDATSPDLSGFKAHGGKLLEYHGWYDGSPAPRHSVDSYREVSEHMGGVNSTQTFYRLYMVPGMMHCGTGPGPNSFGNLLDSSHYGDPERDIFSALQGWVEQGRVPNSVVATKYSDDDPAKPVLMTRPLCSFPEVAQWKGSGSRDEAVNYSCAAPAKH